MKKIRLFSYWLILVLEVFLCYSIGSILYSAIPPEIQGTLPLLMVELVIAPMMVVLGLSRLWVLNPIANRSRIMDAAYFVIPVLEVFACLGTNLWFGIGVATFFGVVVSCELIVSVFNISFRLTETAE